MSDINKPKELEKAQQRIAELEKNHAQLIETVTEVLNAAGMKISDQKNMLLDYAGQIDSLKSRLNRIDLDELPMDFKSHELTWRIAIERAIELEPGRNEKDFWRHELRAFNRAYERLNKSVVRWRDDE